jgi:hypothetical protein
MRQTHTFLLTVLVEDGESELHYGRIQYIADESEAFFRSTEDLLAFVHKVITRVPSPPQTPREVKSVE